MRGFQIGETCRGLFHLGAHGKEVGVDHGNICEGVFQLFLQVGSLGIIQHRQMNLDRGAFALRAGHDRMQDRANLDFRLVTGADRAIDHEGHVGTRDFSNIEPERTTASACCAPRADDAVGETLRFPVEIPQVDCERSGVFHSEDEKILNERVGAVLLEKALERLCVWPRLTLGEQLLGRGEKVFTGKGKIAGSGQTASGSACQAHVNFNCGCRENRR